jgi:hypothetical protein
LSALIAIALLAAPVLRGDQREETPDQRLRHAHTSFHEMMDAPDKGIPLDLFDKAEGQPCGPANPTCTATHLTGNAALGVGGRIFFPFPDVNASYDALLRVNHRFSHGFLLSGSYTYSKILDTASNEIGQQQDFTSNQALDRGPADFNSTNYFVITGVWELPIFRGRHRSDGQCARRLDLEWHFHLPHGFPVDAYVLRPNEQQSCWRWIPSRPADSLCRHLYWKSRKPRFHQRCMPHDEFPAGRRTQRSQFPTLLTDCGAGTDNCFTTAFPRGGPPIGRNSFPGPRFRQTDLSIAKRFGIPQNSVLGENANLEFRANFFNAFNTLNLQPIPNFSSNDDLSNTNSFGRSPGGLAGRVIEFQLRLAF